MVSKISFSLTSDQIRRHEDLSELARVLVLAVPDRVEVLLEMLPEVRYGLGGRVLVRVDSFELVHVEVSNQQQQEKRKLNSSV